MERPPSISTQARARLIRAFALAFALAPELVPPRAPTQALKARVSEAEAMAVARLEDLAVTRLVLEDEVAAKAAHGKFNLWPCIARPLPLGCSAFGLGSLGLWPWIVGPSASNIEFSVG